MFKTIRERAGDALRVLTRGYASARITRLTSDWRTLLQAADEEIWHDLRQLRARSRSLLRDDDYFKQYIRKSKNNIIGFKGMTMKVEAQLTVLPGEASTHGNATVQKDKVLNKTVETAWEKFRKKGYASVCGTLSFRDLENLAVESLLVDGEFIFRYVYSPNGFGLTLQLIDPDWLDENYNEINPTTGNRIVMSVEKDKWDRPVAYFFTPPRRSYYGVVRDFGLSPEGKRVRIDATDIVHGFIPLRAGQTRGVPMAHTAMGRIKSLGRYEHVAVVNASVSAAKMGFISPDKDAEDYDLGPNGQKKPIKILDKVEPGMIQKLPRGWKFESFDPKEPTGVFASFCKQILRGIAAGLGIAYHTLTGDLEGANYSSLRQGALDERDEWKNLQQFMVEHFYELVYERWLTVAVGSPFLMIPDSAIERVSSPMFKPRGWDWVDPEKDATATAIALAAGTQTYTEVLAEKGIDFEDHIDRVTYEREYIKQSGLTFMYAVTKSSVGKEEQQQQQEGDGNNASKDQRGGTGKN